MTFLKKKDLKYNVIPLTGICYVRHEVDDAVWVIISWHCDVGNIYASSNVTRKITIATET